MITVYIYICMKRSFPKRLKRHFKNQCCDANAKFGDHVLEKSCSYISRFSRMELSAIWKRALHIYIHIYLSRSPEYGADVGIAVQCIFVFHSELNYCIKCMTVVLEVPLSSR